MNEHEERSRLCDETGAPKVLYDMLRKMDGYIFSNDYFIHGYESAWGNVRITGAKGHATNPEGKRYKITVELVE